MLKVYCERGAYRKELRELQSSGLIQLVHFPYEGHNRKIRVRATPSVVTMDTTYVTCDDNTPIGEMTASGLFEKIREIVGEKNEFDARHLDSAYKSGCHCFLTPDKYDIVSKAAQLEDLLGLKIFHGTDDWGRFESHVYLHSAGGQ